MRLNLRLLHFLFGFALLISWCTIPASPAALSLKNAAKPKAFPMFLELSNKSAVIHCHSTNQSVILSLHNVVGSKDTILFSQKVSKLCRINGCREFLISELEEKYGRIGCLFDGRILSKPKFITSQSIQCYHPGGALEESLVGKPITMMINKTILPTNSQYKGRPTVLPAVLQATSHHSQRFLYESCGCLPMWYRTENLEEWLFHHFNIGLEYVLIYDNDSGVDHLTETVYFLKNFYNVDLIHWPWDNSQVAMLQNCMLQLEMKCKWIYNIDVDEFLVLGANVSTLSEVYTFVPDNANGFSIPYFSFYPSGYPDVIPEGGQVKAYTCRDSQPHEQPKAAFRPERLHPSRWHIVHYYCFQNGKSVYDISTDIIHLNHYKFPSWSLYRRKFFKRTARCCDVFQGKAFNELSEYSFYRRKISNKCETQDFTLKLRNACEFSYHKSSNLFHQCGNSSTASELLLVGVVDLKINHPQLKSRDSWRLAMKLPNERAAVRFSKILHVVEHPLLAIPRIVRSYTEDDWRYVQLHTEMKNASSMPAMKRALYHWITWNLIIERTSNYRVRFSELANLDVVSGVAAHLELSDAATETLSKVSQMAQEAGCAKAVSNSERISWGDLSSVDEFATVLAKSMTHRYGFGDDPPNVFPCK